MAVAGAVVVVVDVAVVAAVELLQCIRVLHTPQTDRHSFANPPWASHRGHLDPCHRNTASPFEHYVVARIVAQLGASPAMEMHASKSQRAGQLWWHQGISSFHQAFGQRSVLGKGRAS